MSSRRYTKRVWRVPVNRGASEYFAALVVKSLVKHGWPVRYVLDPVFGDAGYLASFENPGFSLFEIGGGDLLPPDLQAACEIAVRVVARTYRVEVTHFENWVTFDRPYYITAGRHFKEVPQ